MTDMTVLDLSIIALEDGAARGLSQTLEPIEAATSLRRTVNGTLVNIAAAQFKKYRSNISGSDQIPPAFDGVWPGDSVVVKCIAELAYLTSGGTPEKSVVAGSSRTDGSTTFYRPQLTMRITNISTATREWDAAVAWSIDLEEV
jgi:hypothetical protein